MFVACDSELIINYEGFHKKIKMLESQHKL